MVVDSNKSYKVGIRDGKLGCSDAQDAFKEYGYLLLYKKNDNYRIDTPEGENIICVDDLGYIEEVAYIL